MTPRELVYKTLEFENKDQRVPRQMWTLPWSEWHYGNMVQKIHRDYPDDIIGAPCVLGEKTIETGDPYRHGVSRDAWGCMVTNIHEGLIGEVREPLVQEDEWEDVENVHIPREWLTFDREQVNDFCRGTDRFVTCGCCPRPFEQLQFIRKTENLYMDLVEIPENMQRFMEKMHSFYCELLEEWAKTEVDALTFMDDWGSQRSLLIDPRMWRDYFKPMYRDYIDIAKRHGKKIFMHSDGYILDILPDLADMGLDAVNSQIFCMGVENLRSLAGKLTFWGEIDRQHLLVEGTPEDIHQAVEQVRDTLWRDGGCIAQCEFGPGANPENVYAVFQAWNRD
ncbi:MAG: uroporphyrinogen decarboxylase family protein [Candidatus Avoscillospira sp.]